ncbi:FAD/NAD(P)-binding domain-containing protein [Athelia psychrophila]|uniref:FAD/NAD(P)-binding domain-containing protein n=1 Tax=Athelia psychrophila TaxID=1759441 RepID=A0A166P8W3_9AGAM|nr:FAD/NAD(P)-binding domain-containing protein [Fibularhizoctonia sp. CBS 109695]
MAPFKLAVIGAGPSAFNVASRLSRASNSRCKYTYTASPPTTRRSRCASTVQEKPDADERNPELRAQVRRGRRRPALPLLRERQHRHDLHLAHPAQPAPPHPVPPVQLHASPLCDGLHAAHAAPRAAPRPALHARAGLVHWYTQHPSGPAQPPLDRLSHVTLIGNGNVSLDITRMLLAAPANLAKYDIPEAVMAVLARSTVKHVSIVARRGPLEAAFTVKELRELINLPGASMVPIDPPLLMPPPETRLSRQQTRMLALLRQGSVQAPGSTPKSWSLDFFRSPTGLAPVPPSPSSDITH